MDKKPRSKGTSDKGIQVPPGTEIQADRQSAGKGGKTSGYYIDEFGRTCYGNYCVKLAIDEHRKEVVVNVNPNADCDLGPVIEALRATLGAGARTVYEVESELKTEQKQSLSGRQEWQP